MTDEKVINKERAKERSKERQKENTRYPISDTGYRRPISECLRDDDFFSGKFDAVDLAICVTDGTRKDRALWRKYLRNGSIDECDFLQCVFLQWRENHSDGMPDNAASCLQAKLNPFRKGAAR